METYNVLFYAKKVKNNPKDSTIYLRITVSGKRTEISTGQTINTSQWGIKSGKVTSNTPNAKQLNALLEGIRYKIFECYTALFNTGKEITCESLRNKYLKIEETLLYGTILQIRLFQYLHVNDMELQYERNFHQ